MKRVIAVLALALLSVGVEATPQEHDHTAANDVIDGKAHPEQIPNTLATRLYLNLITRSGDVNTRLQRERIALDSMQLFRSRQGDAIRMLETYRTQSQELIKSRNEGMTSRMQFWYDFDKLADTTEAGLKTLIEPAAYDAFIASKKRGMRPSIYDPALGAVATRNLRERSMVASMAGMVPGGMTPSYGTATDMYLVATGNGNPTLTLELQVSGDTVLDPPPSISVNTRHTPLVTVKLGTHGTTVNGASVYPANYLEGSNSLTLPASDLGPPLTGDIYAEIECTIAGNFWEDGFLGDLGGGGISFSVGDAETYTYDSGDAGSPSPYWIDAGFPQASVYNQSTACTAASYPPDMYIPTVINLDGLRLSQYVSFGFCVYVNKVPFLCSNNAVAEIDAILDLNLAGALSLPLTKSMVPANCTNWVKGYPPIFPLTGKF